MLLKKDIFIKQIILPSSSACPVCGASCNQAHILTASLLRNAYEAYFSDRCPLNAVPDDIFHVECTRCGLEFCLRPEIPKDFYPWVVQCPSYYPEHRPEWDLILSELASIGRQVSVLEVGCGSGILLKKISSLTNVNAVGIDTSEFAIQKCKLQNLIAIHTDLQTYLNNPPSDLPQNFDFIVGSHVLEHVEKPVELLRDCLDLLNVDGSILMSLPLSPNDHERTMFDPILYPPHHLTRWKKNTFLSLGKTLGTKVTLMSAKRRSPLRALSHSMFCALYYNHLSISIWSRIQLFLRQPIYWTGEAFWQILRRVSGDIVSDHILLKLAKR